MTNLTVLEVLASREYLNEDQLKAHAGVLGLDGQSGLVFSAKSKLRLAMAGADCYDQGCVLRLKKSATVGREHQKG